MILLAACTSSGIMHETPLVISKESLHNITIHRVIRQNLLFDSLIFTIDSVDIYSFGKSNTFKFVLGEGN